MAARMAAPSAISAICQPAMPPVTAAWVWAGTTVWCTGGATGSYVESGPGGGYGWAGFGAARAAGAAADVVDVAHVDVLPSGFRPISAGGGGHRSGRDLETLRLF